MVDIVEFSAIIASAGVIVGIILAFSELRSLRMQRETDIETRQAQLFMQLYDHYQDKEVQSDENEVILQWKWKDPEDFFQKYGPDTNIKAFNKWDSLETYFKGVAVLVERNLIDPDLVNDLVGPAIITHWEKYGLVISELRRRYWPHAFEGYEDLYNEMKKREQKLEQSKKG